jgi:flagella basal body P-ring formation protein FlgA
LLGWSSDSIEALLRQQRPDVARWEIEPLSGEASLPETVTDIGHIAARTAVRFADGHVRWYEVAGYREVLVSTHAIDGAASLSGADARLESRDVLSLGCEPVSELRADVRWRARRHLTAGEVLCDSTIEPAPEVERNRAVTVSARSGGIEVSRVLIAIHDARAGERVRLRDREGVTLIGIVTGTGQARAPGEGT